MNHPSMLFAALLVAAGLAACDRPTVVNNPPATVAVPVPVPGPAGPQGDSGKPGATNIVVVPAPAASEPK